MRHFDILYTSRYIFINVKLILILLLIIIILRIILRQVFREGFSIFIVAYATMISRMEI